MTPEQQAKVVEAAERLADDLYYAIGDNGHHFTCGEFARITDLYEALGQDTTELVRLHARGDDDEGDDHHDLFLAQEES